MDRGAWLQSMGSQRLRHDRETKHKQTTVFTRVKTWKQSKCSSTEEWIKKTWCLYTMEYYSVTKRVEMVPFTETWIDLEFVIKSEISQIKTNII